jgi:hypothetical protein
MMQRSNQGMRTLTFALLGLLASFASKGASFVSSSFGLFEQTCFLSPVLSCVPVAVNPVSIVGIPANAQTIWGRTLTLPITVSGDPTISCTAWANSTVAANFRFGGSPPAAFSVLANHIGVAVVNINCTGGAPGARNWLVKSMLLHVETNATAECVQLNSFFHRNNLFCESFILAGSHAPRCLL